MDMKQIKKLLLALSLVLLASCSTQQGVVYRDCDCNNSNFGFGWNNNPYMGWNSHRFWGWNDPFWGWNDPFWGWNRLNWHYNRPIIVYPKDPTRYEEDNPSGLDRVEIINTEVMITYILAHLNLVGYKIG